MERQTTGMALSGTNAGSLPSMSSRTSLPQIRASKTLRHVARPRQLSMLTTPLKKPEAHSASGDGSTRLRQGGHPSPHTHTRRSPKGPATHTRSPRNSAAASLFSPHQSHTRDGCMRKIDSQRNSLMTKSTPNLSQSSSSPAYQKRAAPRAKSASRARAKSILKPQRNSLMTKSTPNLSQSSSHGSPARGTASEPHITAGGSPQRVSFHTPRKQKVDQEAVGRNTAREQAMERTAPAFLTAPANDEAATHNPVASFLGGASAGKLRWRKIVAKTNAVAKFSTGGRRNYKDWLRDKAKEDEEFFDKLWMQAEQEVQKEEDVARDSVNKFESAIENKLNKKIAERVYMIDRLMRESSLAEFEPTRPGSANLPQHDPNHIVDVEETIVPSLEEKWQLGLDVLAMQDRLDKIAPGNPNSPSRVTSAGNGPRVKNYPKSLPPKPTRKVVCDNTRLSREAALLLIRQICGAKVVIWLKSKDGASTLKELAATYDNKDQDGNYTNRSTTAFETCAAKANVAFRRSSMVTNSTVSG